MNLYKKSIRIACLFIVLTLAACGTRQALVLQEDGLERGVSAPGLASPMEMPPPMPTMMLAAESRAPAAADKALSGNLPPLPIQPSSAGDETDSLPDVNARYAAVRMIIKNAEIKLLVADSDMAIDGVTQIAEDVGGYIISSRLWYQEYDDKNYKYAALTLGVPVEQFETTLRRLRALSIRVLDETASGEDVTDEFVDLESQVKNLEATRDRIRSFLDQARTVDEALRINQQLSDVERQIEVIKGRMNYLSDRSAFSTIMVMLEPQLPQVTPVPSPTPQPWDANETIQRSRETLTRTYQGLAEFFIWLGIVFVPVFGPWILLVWLIWHLVRQKKNRPAPPASS